MHTGFYQKLDDLRKDDDGATFEFMENICTSHKSITAHNFLHGFCTTFSSVLNEIYNYPVCELWDDEGKELIHTYCTIKKDDTSYFIDVRGVTDDFYGEFIEEYEDFYTIGDELMNVKIYDKYIVDEYFKKEAREIIMRYRKYYIL